VLIQSLNIKRSGRTLKELTGLINQVAEEAEWGGITLDEMKQYILMLSLMNAEDNDIRARAARLMEEDNDFTFPEITDDLEHFEQLKKDLTSTSRNRYEINQVRQNTTQVQHSKKNRQGDSTSFERISCYRCNKINHHHSECRYKTVTCSSCNKVGHIAAACKAKNWSMNPANKKQVQQIQIRDSKQQKFQLNVGYWS
jgi:hypothetical protein